MLPCLAWLRVELRVRPASRRLVLPPAPGALARPFNCGCLLSLIAVRRLPYRSAHRSRRRLLVTCSLRPHGPSMCDSAVARARWPSPGPGSPLCQWSARGLRLPLGRQTARRGPRHSLAGCALCRRLSSRLFFRRILAVLSFPPLSKAVQWRWYQGKRGPKCILGFPLPRRCPEGLRTSPLPAVQPRVAAFRPPLRWQLLGRCSIFRPPIATHSQCPCFRQHPRPSMFAGGENTSPGGRRSPATFLVTRRRLPFVAKGPSTQTSARAPGCQHSS